MLHEQKSEFEKDCLAVVSDLVDTTVDAITREVAELLCGSDANRLTHNPMKLVAEGAKIRLLKQSFVEGLQDAERQLYLVAVSSVNPCNVAVATKGQRTNQR